MITVVIITHRARLPWIWPARGSVITVLTSRSLV